MARVFDALSRVSAVSQNMSGLSRVILPHPINHLPDDEIRGYARDKWGEVLRSLTGNTPERRSRASAETTLVDG